MPPLAVNPARLDGLSPQDVLLRWPTNRPLAMLHSGGTDLAWGRWSILAAPTGFYRFDQSATGCSMLGDTPPLQFSKNPMADLDQCCPHRNAAEAHQVPFTGGWIGYLSYDLGRSIESTAQFVGGAQADRDWPLIELAWCPSALVFDHVEGKWSIAGDGDSALDILDDLANEVPIEPLRVGGFVSSLTPDAYLAAVSRVIDAIAAGDLFQANLTQRFTAAIAGSSRRLAAQAFATSRPRYGAYLEFPDGHGIVSMSPELFLHVDAATRGVITRPVKGTRPGHLDASALRDSVKDQAELTMIIDLMRNDLGRICSFGTVRVPEPRLIESHPTVHHGVGTVSGRLRPGIGAGELIRATFPPGSVTGAPKIRAMQLIDELEPCRRGPYCGAIGLFDRSGAVHLNVAIRTICLEGRRPHDRWDHLDGLLDYGTGGGIVADSKPLEEYRESLDKAAVLQLALDEMRAAIR